MRDSYSLNKVILAGRLGKNPELRYVPQTEQAVANFSIATSEKYYNKQTEESSEKTEWHRIVVWGKTAEFVDKYITQGQLVLIEGKLRTRSWEKDGQKHYTTEVHAQQVITLGKGKNSDSGDGYASGGYTSETPEDDGEVPF